MDDKPKILSLKNIRKQDISRLSSLNISRDLNLGGTKAKKVYTPNLNAVRNKQTKTKVQAVVNNRKNAVRTQRQFDKTNNGRYVQSSGVFSDGTAFIKRPTLYSDKHANAREADTSSGMIKPKLGNNWNINVEEEAGVVEDLLACDEDSGSENEGEYEPIVLPLSANKDGFMNTFKVKKEPEIKIKKEPDDGGLTNGFDLAKVKHEDVENFIQYSSFSSNKIYNDENLSVSLVKLPDSLPGKGFDDENKIVDYTLNQMIEGKIGKILIRKSGKIDVVIGKTNYTLDAVEAAQFTEELMCTADSEDLKRDPFITNLGPINEKFVISPIWPNLLLKKPK